ncbi:MAG TPA: hypothetical protein VHD56_13860 [Tepidisphaeraceae bacterium]|nr:hypothetical protein [Tepidisphaeraceae bacterium]
MTILIAVNRAGFEKRVVWIAVVALSLSILGCGGRGVKSVNDPDPSLKIPAIKAAADAKDSTQVVQLVKDLSNDDPAVRFYSIGALERLTGQTFGYQYFVDDDQRAPAVERWRAWLAGWEAAQKTAPKK